MTQTTSTTPRKAVGNPITKARGEAVRRALLAIASRALSQGCPMPARPRLAEVLGCCEEQVRRHWDRLVKEGRIVERRYRSRHCRIHVLEVRP